MSFGSLHILQHKSWHVYSEKNREKVKRDEEAARLEEESKQKRIETAESEHRLSVLRARAKQLVSQPATEDDEVTAATQDTDVPASRVLEGNNAEDAESLVVVRAKDVFGNDVDNNFVVRTNPEREAEEKVKKERVDRRQNVYLDQSEKERRRWYTMPKKETLNTEGEEPGLVFKRRADPLAAINNALRQKEKRAGNSKTVVKDTNRHIPGKQPRTSIPSGDMTSVDLLRKEREERERQERRKLQILLNPGLLEPRRPHQMAHAFSSQYNPTLTHEAHVGRSGNVEGPLLHFKDDHVGMEVSGRKRRRDQDDDDRREERSRYRMSTSYNRNGCDSKRNQRNEKLPGEKDGIDEKMTSRERDEYRPQERRRSPSRNRDRSRSPNVNGKHGKRRRRDRS